MRLGVVTAAGLACACGSIEGGGSGDAGVDRGEAGYVYGGVTIPADRFAESVVSFTPGGCAGFGQASLPGVVLGPPIGGGAEEGSLDVVSLGVSGSIVLAFGDNAIVDGPGTDFIVFENVFDVAGDPLQPNAELGEVSVSDDGVHWFTFACTAKTFPYGACAGWHPTFSSPASGISPVDPAKAGGDPFDLADLHLSRARYVRVTDKSGETCAPGSGVKTAGFDLDAVSIVHSAK